MSLREGREYYIAEEGRTVSHEFIRQKLQIIKARVDKKARAAQDRFNRTLKTKRREAKKLSDKIDEGKVTVVDDTLLERHRRVIEDKVTFRPNPGPQEEFFSSPETDVLYGGAAGGGKSYAMIVDALRYCHRPTHKALILRKTMPELRELIDKSRELYPKAFPGARFKEQEKIWKFTSGAQIHFGFLDKDADVYRYQGSAYSYIGFDEITHLATEYPWQYLASRLRTTDPEIQVYLRCTANPGGVGHQWVKQRYIDPAPPNTAFRGKDGVIRKFIPAMLSDNPHLHADGRYEQMLKSLNEVERRRLLEGDWNISEGAAFPEFSRTIHVIEPFKIPTSWVRFKAADYGYTAPSAVLWFAIDPEDNTIICYRELYAKGLTGTELGKSILELEMEDIGNIPGVLDTAAWNKTGYTGPTIGQELNQLGCGFRPADKNRIAGKIQIHERLKVTSTTGRPKLQFFKTCKNIVRELETIPLSKSNSEDVDTTVDDHAYDALRYGLMSRPRFTTPAEQLLLIRREVGFTPADPNFGY